MKIKVLTALVLLLVFTRSTAQSTAYSIDTVATTGANDKLESFYFTLQPLQPSKGLLVIIPGFMTPPQEMMKETRLHDAAVAKGYTVLIPFLILPNATETMGLVQRRLEIIVTKAMKKYRIPDGKLVIGGHSIGGLYAMCYAETTQKPGRDSLVKPAAVFGVDPPLDLKRLYNGYDRAMKEGVGLNSEATMITERFRKIFGGTPQQEAANYEKESAYTADAAQGGNTHYLKNMPVRLYCDPDINWFIRERQTSVAWLNLADLTGCIVALNKMGNKKAELVTALGKGYLSNGTRHPHAFSLLDADECVTWFNRILYPHDK
ncbi:hypothetical protein [Paraflavitalea sp. CAU 1676]|uniref:hypothetical protein n=1 Tax=Paraflavitalea sp. CAU 1676 TaxID=3032598 RepID=UPI0023D9FAD6|nr:hypothetical protein [Paraflavitalea sp. CAU 1676]MDF2190970.1 hypothetical protein [Paraflavitalea sp. CAU 1676]